MAKSMQNSGNNKDNPKLIIAAEVGWPGPNCAGADACAWYANCDSNGCSNAHIRMKRWQDLGGGTKTWGVVTPGPGASGYGDFPGVLIHELGHILGLHHPGECGQNTNVGVMACTTACSPNGESRYLRKDDIEGVRARYGWKRTVPVYNESADALTWTTGATAVPNYNPDTKFGSITNSQAGDDQMFIAFPYSHNARFATYDSLNGWMNPHRSLEWTVNGNTWKPVAIAMDRVAPNYVAAAWLANESETQDNQNIRWAVSRDEGTT